MKRLLSLLLALCMALALFAGCGQQQNTETPAATVAPTATATPAQTAAPAATPEPTEEPEPLAALLAGPIPYDEYERGIWYGFLPDALADADPDATVVTWRQFCDMLGRFIERYQPESLPAWEEQTAAAPDTPMKRDDGAIALLFAARTVDLDYYNEAASYGYIADFDGDECSFDYPLFAWDEPYQLIPQEGGHPHTAMFQSFLYCFAFRISLVSGMRLMEDIDGERHLDYDFPLRDALCSVTRLYESVTNNAFACADALLERVKQTPEAQEIIAAAEQRKAEILNSETKIVKSDEFIQGETYTGTAYYVSNSGDDANDGLSPETAWATIGRLASEDFAFGDAIFFERGGLWREVEMPGNVRETAGLTISAYGAGEKPRLYGSPENGAGAEKWELYYEGANGEKIWKYHREMPETTAVVMNDGATYAKRDLPFWNGTEYVLITDRSTPYHVESELADMRFFTELLYPAKAFDPYHIFYAGFENNVHTFVEGTLYLRCDAGNPGELYDSIEFATAHCMYDGMPIHTTIDNLNISYCNPPGGGGNADGGMTGNYIYIQNCEMGWGGGKVSYFVTANTRQELPNAYAFYDLDGEDTGAPPELELYFQDGGALNVQKSHQRILNNYAHHQYQEGITLETSALNQEPIEDLVYAGNLAEYCGLGMTIINWDGEPNPPHIFSNVHFEDNMVLYPGFENLYTIPQAKLRIGPHSSVNGNLRESWAYGTMYRPNAHDGTLTVSGNTFAFAVGELLMIGGYTEEYSHVLDGNTYAQLPGMVWLHEVGYVRPGDMFPPFYYITDPEAAIRDWVRDEHATIIRFDQ